MFKTIIAPIALSILTVSAFAGGPDMDYSKNNSFWLGGYGGVSSTSYEFDGLYTDIANTNTLTANTTANQNDYMGGFTLGYQYSLTHLFALGVEFDGGWFSGNASTTTHIDDAVSVTNAAFDIKNELKLKRVFELTADPSLMLSKALRLFVKFGAAFGRINNQLTSLDDTTNPPNTLLSTNEYINSTGFVIGAGLSVKLAKCLYAFAEYNYINFGKINFNLARGTSGAGQNDTYSSSANITNNTVKLGLATSFNF